LKNCSIEMMIVFNKNNTKKMFLYLFTAGIFLMPLLFPIYSFPDTDKERLEYNFAKDNLKRIEEQALKTYESIIKKGGKYKNQAILDVGKHYYEKEDYRRSLEYLNRIYRGLDDEDISAEANLYRGRIYSSYKYTGRDLNESFASFFYIIDVYPNSRFVKDALFELAKVYAAERDFTKAIKLFIDIVIEYPDCSLIPSAYVNVGMCYVKLDKLSFALKWFKKLLDEYSGTEYAEMARKYVSQILKVNLLGTKSKVMYGLDRSYKPDFKAQKARSLRIIGVFEEKTIKAADYSAVYTVASDGKKITKESLDGVVDFFSYRGNNCFTLLKTGLYIDDKEVPLTIYQAKNDISKNLRNLVRGGVDSKGNLYIIDSIVDGLHVFDRNCKFVKTIRTNVAGKIKSIAIDPMDRINLLAPLKDSLVILDDAGEEIETINLEERFGIAKATKLAIDWVGNKFILDRRNKAIYILNASNELLHRFFLSKDGNVLVKNPEDFCIDEADNLYVLDGRNNTVVKFK